jgi:hypothetical protein
MGQTTTGIPGTTTDYEGCVCPPGFTSTSTDPTVQSSTMDENATTPIEPGTTSITTIDADNTGNRIFVKIYIPTVLSFNL